MFRLEHLARQEGIPVLIVIDALNQLDEAGGRLGWLPKTIPSGVNLVISTTPGETEDHLLERECSCLEEISRHCSAVGLDEVFQGVLERLERDYGEPAVRGLLTAIWGSRSGMSEVELLESVGLTRLELSRLLPALDYHLLRKDGRLGFFHDYLRHAVEQRYLLENDRQRQLHILLAGYFERTDITARSAAELIYQHRQSESWEELASALSQMDRFMVLWRGEMEYEILRDWRELGEHGIDIEICYRQGLAEWMPVGTSADRMKQESLQLDGVQRVAKLYERLDRWEAAAVLFAQEITIAREAGHRDGCGAGHLGLGWIHFNQGRYDEAMEELTRADEIYSELDDRSGLSVSIGYMGMVHYSRGEYDRAMECYSRKEFISRELGDRSGVSRAIGYMGIVHPACGKYDRALECYAESESICRELGDRTGLSVATGNMGNIHSTRGEYEQAIECFARALDEHRRIRYPFGITYWLAGNALVLLHLSATSSPMPEYLKRYLPDVSEETWKVKSLGMARENAEECVAISGQLSKPDTLFASRVLLARIDAAEGNSSAAREQIEGMLRQSEHDDQLAELNYWLSKEVWDMPLQNTPVRDTPPLPSSGDSQRGGFGLPPETLASHRAESLRLYQSLLSRTPNHAYRQRVEELTSALNSKASESNMS